MPRVARWCCFASRLSILAHPCHQAKGESDMAGNDYEDIVQQDPNNMTAMKRQVALLRARGRPVEATRKLVEHLGVVCSDTESWLQLCDMYLTQQQYTKVRLPSKPNSEYHR